MLRVDVISWCDVVTIGLNKKVAYNKFDLNMNSAKISCMALEDEIYDLFNNVQIPWKL